MNWNVHDSDDERKKYMSDREASLYDEQKAKNPSYKYGEDKILTELKKYIDSTYDEHYSKNKFQSSQSSS